MKMFFNKRRYTITKNLLTKVTAVHLNKTAWLLVILLFILSSCTSQSTEQNLEKSTPSDAAIGQRPTFIMQSLTNTPTTVPIDPTKTPDQKLPDPLQVEETIPSCLNDQTPYPFSDLKEIPGVIVYSNNERDQWFTLSGSPPVSVAVNMPSMQVNSLALPSKGQTILAYSIVPEKLDTHRAAFLLKPSSSPAKPVEVDMVEMVKYYEDELGAGFAPFQTWSIRWVNENIILIDATFSETATSSFHLHQYRLYDIVDFVWRDDLTQELPQRQLYQWLDISPDLKSVLYVDKQYDLVLWDLEEHKKVWSDHVSSSIDQSPLVSVWSPDSQYIALVFGNFTKIISRDGDIVQTILDPIFQNADETYLYNRSLSWSPNSNLLAISGVVHYDDETIQSMFYIFDISEQIYTFRCPFQDKAADLREPQTSVIWSSDGNYILPSNPRYITVPFRLYGLRDKTVYQISENDERVIGWFGQFPEMWK